MKLITIILLLITTLTFSQKKVYYSYGYDGIHSIGKINDSTVIYSHYKARPYIKEKVFKLIISNYKLLKSGPYKLSFDNIVVNGRLKIQKKPKYIFIDYYYESIEYADTLVEIYKKPQLKSIKTSKKRISHK